MIKKWLNRNIDEEEHLSRSTQRNLLNVSKILNCLAHNMTDKYEDPENLNLKNFITEFHPQLLKNLNYLTVIFFSSTEKFSTFS